MTTSLCNPFHPGYHYFLVVFQADLAVHKKKVGEVQQWLEFALSSVGLLVWLDQRKCQIYHIVCSVL